MSCELKLGFDRPGLSDPTRFTLVLVGALAALGCGSSDGEELYAKVEPVCKTEWKPATCRSVASEDAVFASRAAWRNLHAGPRNDDEVSIAFVPEFEQDWIAEPETFNATGPVFDDAGNLYFSPLLPKENVALISLEPEGGQRRWAIEGSGALSGAGTPMILDDRDHPGEQLVYLGLKDRALAVRTDGTLAWEGATGLIAGENDPSDGVFGVNYHPQTDSIVGLTATGQVYALSRATGQSILQEPFELPGSPSPKSSLGLPDALMEGFGKQLATLMNLGDPSMAGRLIDALLGNSSKVANFFSIDPRTGRLWIAATAPDAEDGSEDGVSELGSIVWFGSGGAGRPGVDRRGVPHRISRWLGIDARTPS